MSTTMPEAPSVPRSLPLGGREFLFSKLSEASYASLAAWLGQEERHPFRTLARQRKAVLEALGPQEYKALLLETWEVAKSWPPDPRKPAGKRALLFSDEGSAALIRVALAQHGQDVSDEEATAILTRAQARPEEMIAVLGALFGFESSDELAAGITSEVGPTAGPGRRAG